MFLLWSFFISINIATLPFGECEGGHWYLHFMFFSISLFSTFLHPYILNISLKSSIKLCLIQSDNLSTLIEAVYVYWTQLLIYLDLSLSSCDLLSFSEHAINFQKICHQKVLRKTLRRTGAQWVPEEWNGGQCGTMWGH